MKKRRFAAGGETFSPEQEKWLGGADRTDPYILARMRRAVPDTPNRAPVEDRRPDWVRPEAKETERAAPAADEAPKRAEPKASAPAEERQERAEPKASAPRARAAAESVPDARPRGMQGYRVPPAAAAEDTPMSRIPGVVSDKGPTPSAGNSAGGGSELGRNIYNTAMALPGLSLARAGAAGARAAQGAQSASRALSTGAETPVTFLGKTAGKAMNAPRLAGKSTDVVAKEAGAGAKAAEKATSKVSGPQKTLAGPKDKADNVKEAARKLSDRDKKAKGRASRDIVSARESWARGPRAMKRGGTVQAYAQGGMVRGWGQARGARSAKIV